MNSLGVKNIYELLDEDSSGGVESGKKVQAAIQQQKKEAIAASKPAVVAKPTQTAATSQPKKQNERKGDKQVGDKVRSDRPRFDRADRKPRNPDSPVIEGEDRKDRKRFNGERRPRVEGEQPRGNKRQFDRRSGTGRSLKENKKGGAGKGNWGTATDEQAATIEEGAKVETEETKKEGEEGTTVEGETAAAVQTEKPQQQAAEPEEEEEKVRTLEEYLTSKKTVAALPSQRVVNDEEQRSKWKDFVPMQKDEESLFSVEGKQGKKEKAGKEGSAESKKVSADQVIKFQKEKPNKRENTRAPKQPKQARGPKQGTPNITDEKSFPALSPKA